MDFTCGLVDKFRDLVLDLTWEQLHYLIYYHRNMVQFNEQLEQLTLKRISIQHQKEEAENNVEQIEEEVQCWLHKVDEIWEKVQMLLEKSQDKTERSITSCPNPWLRYKLSKRAKAMAQEISEIFANASFTRVSYRVPPPSLIELPTRVNNEGIDSRVQIKSQIIEALRDPSVKMVGLCGLGGVGKTTIAKDVTKEEEIQKMFKKVIMATVSQEMNIGNIQDQIIDKLGMQVNERTDEVKAFRLCERLKEEKDMLLILDDLWAELDLGKVGVPFVDVEKYGKNNEGCKILLTSRNEILLSNCMKCQKLIKVTVFSEDEAWELFKSIGELSIDSSDYELQSIATEIVQKCGGLPLAIATAAKALQEKDINGWKDYLARLKHPLTRSFTGIKEVDTILRLSYDHLSQENKHIFLLAAMISHFFSIEVLLMYSVGLDIFKHIKNMEEAHNGISTVVRKLKSLNLFLDTSFPSNHFTIHDVFRDLALSIASDELKVVIVRHGRLNEWPDEDEMEHCRGICLQESGISDLPEELHGPMLEFFLLNGKRFNLAIPNMFFKSSKKLKLLAFTNVHFSSLTSLMFLEKLKALCLHSCVLEDITEVGRLTRLKVLSLAHSEVERLPIDLKNLTSLQMLNLSHCSNLRVIPQKLLSSFEKLEVLYMEDSFDHWNDGVSSKNNENASLDELTNLPISCLDISIPNVSMLPEKLFSYMKLKRYKILIGKRWRWWQVNEKTTSKILRLELESNIDLTAGIRKLLAGVEDLYLYGSNGHENVFVSHDGRGFPCLKHLQIESNDDIKYIVLNSAHHEDAFPILQSLELKNLKALESLCDRVDAIEFRELHTLKMKNLPALIGDLSLKDRETTNVSNKILKSLFNKVLFPKLEILKLSNLNSLIALAWDDQLSHNSFSNLKTFTVEKCGFVKLVPFHVLKSLNNLEELEAKYCDMLETVFDFEDSNDFEEIVPSSMVVPLRKLKLSSLPKLKNVWCNHNQGNVCFPSLRSVDIYKCKSLTSIFPTSIAKDMLGDLEELSIIKCGIDVIVAKDQVFESVAVTFEFPKLTSLTLSRLEKLRNFYPYGHTLKCPNLQWLSIQFCDELKIFEKEVPSSSEIHEDEATRDSKYPPLPHDKVVHELEMRLGGEEVEMIRSDPFLLYHSPNVKLVYLSANNATNILYRSLLKGFPKLEDLQLSGEFKEAFGGDDVTASLKLTLSRIPTLISLSQFLISPPNITYLHVTSCYQLTTLITSSTARSLIHLTHLLISHCNKIQEIIAKQEGDDEDKEIIFNKLELLELHALPRLKRFCRHNYTFRFPLLDNLMIRECPKVKIFSSGIIHTPYLRNVQLSYYRGGNHEILDRNLNKTIYQQRFVKSREVMLDEDDASMIRNGQFPVECCPKVEILRIDGFVEEWVTFTYPLLERFPKLNELHVKHCSFKELFPSHAPYSSSFHNLTVLKVYQCHQLVYLMTNSTAKSLMNLETMEVHDCEKMEEIIRKEPVEDVEGGITFNGLRMLKLTHLPSLKTELDKRDFNIEDRAAKTRCTNISRSLFRANKVLLPKLNILELSSLLNNLISLIWDDQLLHNSFSNLKILIVESCAFIKMVPICVLKSLNNLKKLEVSNCQKLEMVIGYEDLNDYYKEMESSSVLLPLNLTHLEVYACYRMTTLTTISAARSLAHITHLSISYCEQIEEILTKQEGEHDEDKEISFNKMEFLELVDLPRLQRFCCYNYTFSFPLLEHVTIRECPHLTMFCPEGIHVPLLRSIQVHLYKGYNVWMTNLNNTVQHLFTFKEVISTTCSMVLNAKNIITVKDVFPEVRRLYVESFPDDEGVTFPYSFLERFPKMNWLCVEHSSFEEIFPSHDHIIAFKGKFLPLQRLFIAYLDKLKSIWKDDFELPPIHQSLEVLIVKSCGNLVKLAPSCASFENLWQLSICGCNQLIYLVTSSIAKSLVSLEWLEIHDCKKMEEIVMNGTNEDAIEGGITFNKLCVIILTDMRSLKIFSSQAHIFEFPKLEEIEITECPEMKIFCRGVLKTPKLSKVKIEGHDMEWKEEEDLNKTMEGLSLVKGGINI